MICEINLIAMDNSLIMIKRNTGSDIIRRAVKKCMSGAVYLKYFHNFLSRFVQAGMTWQIKKRNTFATCHMMNLGLCVFR